MGRTALRHWEPSAHCYQPLTKMDGVTHVRHWLSEVQIVHDEAGAKEDCLGVSIDAIDRSAGRLGW